MFRKMRKIRIGIRLKITLSLVILFITSGTFLYCIISRQIDSNIQTQITKDLQELKTNTEVYVRQTLIMYKGNNDEDSYKKLIYNIVQELYTDLRQDLAAYTKEGEVVLSTKKTLFQNERKDQDFQYALKNKSAYSMKYLPDGGLTVVFSMPIQIEKKEIGIIRYQLDYTELRQQGSRTAQMILKVIIIVFAVIFLLIYCVITQFIKPIRQLTQTSNLVAENLMNNRINENILTTWTGSERGDEIGELSKNYSIMLDTVITQFQKMQQDQDRILKLMNTKQEFYNNVTHELKTPLTTISGFAQLIKENGREDEELLQKGIDHIMHESTRLHQMVLQLLEMSDSTTKQNLTTIYLERLIRSVVEAMKIKANRYNNEIVLHLEKGLRIQGQEAKIRQVFINLIDNAIKYGMPREEIVIHAYCKEGYVWVLITNKGEGIAKEHIMHIFEPLYRVDKKEAREKGSTGLGLSICQKIMKEHNAEIQVSSDGKQETTFTLRFVFEERKSHENK
ncbi:sensor histidine kinase [Anaerosacchariphilus polymeriproducens]|uniref:histidine kinase n=1 Tax=Anaerosacchariphilus polymeriproducens TaxID=1812858 RepID=A0A371AT26_9FIRM|nr:HAMP domain-containing sensor histidine kinase [Anaerosacchariphilus polymeriproducens]RDU22727.1 HAMP domain-containing protein [Anaerosacchariphilus polymeriproducens]